MYAIGILQFVLEKKIKLRGYHLPHDYIRSNSGHCIIRIHTIYHESDF